jgi:hypothetical protein
MYSREDDHLLHQCMVYFDKLIELWSSAGFTLVTDNTNSGVYKMQSDVYVHQSA